MAKKENRAEFIQWMPKILDCLREVGGSAKPREVYRWIAEQSGLDSSVLDEKTKSGQGRFHNQVAWGRQYLVWEGLLDGSRRGYWTLSPLGWKTVLTDLDAHQLFLHQVARHQEIRQRNAELADDEVGEKAPKNIEVPIPQDEVEEEALLDVLKGLSPKGFELVCKRLLSESGFENVIVTGRSHDGGIDGYGVLRLNAFVSMKVVFQCKKYKNSVGRSEIGDFRNAMLGRAEKGIFITTGTFTSEAIKEAARDGAPPIELVDGERLVELFEEAKLGVRPKTVFEIDYAFFEQFRNE